MYLGDTVIEGFQGLTMIDEMDNKAALLTRTLLTRDGVSFDGFASTKEAIDYDYKSPLRWWPAQIAVTELSQPPPPGTSWKYFPQPLQFALSDAASHLRGLTALAGGFATFYALTDFANSDVGGQPSSRATFDGDPFPADNQLADGEESPHDRALAIIKVALVEPRSAAFRRRAPRARRHGDGVGERRGAARHHRLGRRRGLRDRRPAHRPARASARR